MRAERAEITRELGRHHAEVRRLAVTGGDAAAARLLDLHERIGAGGRRTAEIAAKAAELGREQIGDADVRAALADFEDVWRELSPKEQARVLALLVARVEYDAGAGTVSVTFHPSGIRALSERALEEAA